MESNTVIKENPLTALRKRVVIEVDQNADI